MITWDDLEVPINIVHFKEGNALVFPFLMEDSDYERMSELAKDSDETIYDFLDSVMCGGHLCAIEYPTKNLFLFIQDANLESLEIIAYREILEIPYDLGGPILFVDGKIVSSKDIEIVVVQAQISDEIPLNFITHDEQKYWSYEGAEYYYLMALKNSIPNQDKV
ncbi:hypothetical protein [Pedobacter caeni]|nr:hypothetical protein [Pedobacter caeni]